MEIFGISIRGLFVLLTIIFGLFVLIFSKFSRSRGDTLKENFIETESRANSVRKKDISNLKYITIPFETLPFVTTDDYNINACQKELRAFDGKKIVNLSHLTNTEPKMEYGVANLPVLSEYDENCMRLFRTIANLGFHLSNAGFHDEAISFLEFGIENGSDISRNYYVLADEYLARGQEQKVSHLIEIAEQIPSLMGPSIVKELNLKLASISGQN